VLLAGLLVVGWQVPARAQEGQPFRWKAFDPGAKPFYQVQSTRTTQVMTVMGMEVKQDQEQTFYMKWTPAAKKERINGKDHWVVTQQIIGAKMVVDIGGNKIAYDSTEENQPESPLTEFFKALVGCEITYYVTEDFQVTRVGGVEEFRQKLVGNDAQRDALLKSILTDASLKQMAESTWGAYPPKGDFQPMKQWEKTHELNLGPLGVYRTRNAYTCEPNPIKIKVRTTVEYQEPARAEKGLPFKIVKAKLSGNTAREGEAVFDRNKGRFEKSFQQTRLEGELTIDTNGTEAVVQLIQTQESRMRTQDEDPVAEIKKKRQQ
jgi:hypothetical protein